MTTRKFRYFPKEIPLDDVLASYHQVNSIKEKVTLQQSIMVVLNKDWNGYDVYFFNIFYRSLDSDTHLTLFNHWKKTWPQRQRKQR